MEDCDSCCGGCGGCGGCEGFEGGGVVPGSGDGVVSVLLRLFRLLGVLSSFFNTKLGIFG